MTNRDEESAGQAGSAGGAGDAGRGNRADKADARAGQANAQSDYSNLGEQLEVGPSDRRAMTNRLRANAGLFGLMALGLLAIIVGGVLLANAVASW